MAGKKSQQGEEEVLGQIFDFIFTEARKPPVKRKPIKTTGISSSKALADGLALAIEAPGLLITDQVLESMNDALNVEFGSIDVGDGGKVKFSTTSMVDFLSDPGKFLSKAQEKAKASRSMNRAQFLGKGMQGLLATAWARKYNLDLDAQKAILGHYKAKGLDGGSVAALAFGTAAGSVALYSGQMKPNQSDGKIQDSDKQYVVNRNADLIGREIFGRRGWEDMAPERKIEFQKSLVGGEESLKAYMDRTYTGTSEKWKDVALKRYGDLKQEVGLSGKGADLLDMKAYDTLEKRNIDGRIEDLEIYLKSHHLSSTERENIKIGIQRLKQARVIVSGQQWDIGNIAKTKIEVRKRISDSKEQMLQAQKNGDFDTVRRLRREIRDWKSGERELNTAMLFGRIGQAEGVINSWKSVMGGVYGENAVLSILNGDFFNGSKNQIFNPVKELKVGIGSHKVWNDEKKEFENVPDEALSINIAAYDKGLKGMYSKIMTPIYYLTPKSIMKSLFVNGEGFIFMYTSSLQRAMKKNGIKDFDWENLWNADYLKSKGLDPKSFQVQRSLAKFFSAGQRVRDRMNKWFNENIGKRVRQVVYNKLISRITDVGARELMAKWLARGGFQVIAKALAVTIINALGIVATGGLGAFLIPILTTILVDVLYGAAKIIIQVVLLLLLGVVGLLIFGGSAAKDAFDSKSFAYTNVVPGEVYTNPNFTQMSPINGGEFPEGNHPFSGGSLPDGVQCLIGSNQFRCSQGAFGSYSHASISAVDIPNVDTFYAPTFCGEGNCVVTAVQDVNCYYGGRSYYAGGMVIFTANYDSTTYTFKLIHVYKNVSVGQKLSAGQAVADIITGADHDKIKNCSTGSHLHLETKVNGSTVDPMDVMTNSTSSGGFGCNISACPVP